LANQRLHSPLPSVDIYVANTLSNVLGQLSQLTAGWQHSLTDDCCVYRQAALRKFLATTKNKIKSTSLTGKSKRRRSQDADEEFERQKQQWQVRKIHLLPRNRDNIRIAPASSENNRFTYKHITHRLLLDSKLRKQILINISDS